MKTHSAIKQPAEKKVSALLELIKNAKTISDGSGKPHKKYVNDEYISNSYLSMLLRELVGTQQFFGNEHYLKFGNEIHKRLLKPAAKKFRLDKTQEALLKAMLARLAESDGPHAFMRGAQLEVVSVKPIQVYSQTQMVKVILDMRKGKKAKDLKTTSATDEKGFLKSARSYKYFRQAFLYSEAEGITDFEFLGISKKKPHNLFYLPVNDFPIDKQQGKEEALELMSLHIALKRLLKIITN